jgi:hypothetical protein
LDVINYQATDWNPSANYDVMVFSVSGNSIYAGGYFTAIGGKTRNHIACLDIATGLATDWNPNAVGPVASVLALVVRGENAYVGGEFDSIGGQKRDNIACIDAITGFATNWNPDANKEIYALSVNGNSIYTGGGFTVIGGQTRNHIACLDATTGFATDWNPNASSYVYALSVSGNSIYTGGAFSVIDGQTRNRIACLDATTGHAINWNPNANSYVFSLSASGNSVYAGGEFTSIGSQTRNHIASLDATTGIATDWYPYADDDVFTLTVIGNSVYAGGIFTSIGGLPCSNFAQFDFTPASVIPKTVNTIANSFITSPSGRTIRYFLSQRSPVSLRLFDIRGRQIASFVNCIQSPGTYTVPLGSQSLPAGFYLIQLKTGNVAVTKQCVLVR